MLSSLAVASPLSKTEKEGLESRSSCVVSHLEIFNDDIKYGLPFCQFYISNTRDRSPSPGLTAQQVYDVCQCIIDGQFQPAARVGADWTPISTFKAVTRTIVQYSTVTAISPVTRVATVTEKRTIVQTVTAKASNAGAGAANGAQSTKTIAKTTVTQKVTAAKITITQKVTIAKTTVTAKGNPTSTIKTTVTFKPSTVTVARTVVQKSTMTIAKTTVTANNQNAKPTTVFRTTTMSAVASPQKTVTVKTTITAKASGSTAAASVPVKTVTSIKTFNSPQKTVTVAQTTVTAKASSGAQVTSTRTVTSVKTVTVGASSTSASQPSKESAVVSNTKPIPIASAAPTSAAASSASNTAAATTTDLRATCSLQPTSTPSATVMVGDTSYERFYRGCGYTEDPNNPGNAYYADNFPPVVTNFTEVLTPDEAVQQCAEDAFYRFDDPNQYLSFDLHFVSNGNGGLAGDAGAGFWQCVQYFSDQSETDTSGYFDIANPSVSIAYGYTSGLYSDAAAAAAKANSKRDVVKGESHKYPSTRGQRLTWGFSNATHAGH
ncbi:hypothetical protein KCU62_g4309, partial [Aureobasidium sp. EXF-3399]